MEEKTSIKELKEMIKEYLIAQEDRTRLIIDGWKYEENEYEIQEIGERISEYEDELIYVERNNEILNKVEEKLRDFRETSPLTELSSPFSIFTSLSLISPLALFAFNSPQIRFSELISPLLLVARTRFNPLGSQIKNK